MPCSNEEFSMFTLYFNCSSKDKKNLQIRVRRNCLKNVIRFEANWSESGSYSLDLPLFHIFRIPHLFASFPYIRFKLFTAKRKNNFTSFFASEYLLWSKITSYSFLSAYFVSNYSCLLSLAHCPLLSAQCLQPTVYWLVPTVHCPLPTLYCQLFTAHSCPLFTAHSGQWAVHSGHRAVDSGLWAVDRGKWTVDSGQWTLGSTQWAADSRQ